MSLVEVKHLVKNYKQFEAVNDISFEIQKGSILAFLGPNGAGKSTTMKILSTLLYPTSGTVYVANSNVPSKIRKEIGIVFQENTLDEELTVYENLKYRGMLYFTQSSQLKKRIIEITKELELSDILNKPYRNCSGGQKRLVMIARALLHNPKLIILDEPTTGLDPRVRKTVWSHLIKLKEEQQLTIFFSSHYIDEAMYADNVCIVNQGKVMMLDTPQRIIETFGRKKLTMLLEDEELSVPVQNAQEALTILNNKKYNLRSFECVNPSLEEIFLSYTKRTGTSNEAI